MNTTALRPAAAGAVLAAVALAAFALTGCGPEDGVADGGAAKPPAATAPAPAEPAPVKPAATTAAPATTPADTAPTTTATAPAPARSATPKPAAGTAPACSSTPPTPDEVDLHTFAVYRTETVPGDSTHINLVVQHGRWGCPDGESDGLPYITTGEDSRWAMDQAAYITVTNPITDSSANRRIGVQEFLDWVKANPDSGLVFRYQTGDDGAVDRLDQVYAP
jgi:hypothetical protein